MLSEFAKKQTSWHTEVVRKHVFVFLFFNFLADFAFSDGFYHLGSKTEFQSNNIINNNKNKQNIQSIPDIQCLTIDSIYTGPFCESILDSVMVQIRVPASIRILFLCDCYLLISKISAVFSDVITGFMSQ